MWTGSLCSVQPYQTGRWICVIRPRDQVSEPELLHFDHITGLKTLSIYLFLLAGLNLGLEMDRLPVQASQEALCSNRERERGEREKPNLGVLEPTSRALCCRDADCLSGVGTYIPDIAGPECRLFRWCRNLPPGNCRAGVQAV